MKNKNLKEYLELKNLIKERHYKDYPLNKVVGSYLGMMVWKPSLKLYIDYLFLNPNNIKLSDSENIIYTYSTKRESYIDLIKAYFPSALPQYVRIKNSTKGKVLGFIPSFLSIVKGFQFTKEIECSFSQRLKLATVFSISFKIIDQLEKKEVKCQKYIAFNSSYLVESFISYYFRKRGIKTYSLQHGMYFNYINDTPYDVINYENVCSDYLLLWGNYSKNEISKLIPNSSNYIVFGYPKSKFPILSKQIKSERIFVILPRDIYLDDSIKLLNFLKDYKIQFTIRPHPSISTKINDIIKSNDNFIIDSAMLLSESLNKHKYRAIISFNSTAIFEAALYEQNVYLFKTNKNEFKNPGFNELTLESDLIIELGKGKLIQKDSFFSEKINLEKDK